MASVLRAKFAQAGTPIIFNPSMETPEPDEAKTVEGLLEAMLGTRQKTYEDTGHAMRSVHVKSHGLLKGELEVLPGLPPTLAQGLFAKAASYPLIMRFSTTPSDMIPDKISTPRGCAIKIVGVEGARLPGSESATTQDFVMVNGGPSFQVASLKAFLNTFKPLAATTDKAEGVKVAVSAIMKTVEKGIEALGKTSAIVRNIGGEPENHILGETFFSQAPILWGDHIAKISLVPVSTELKAFTGKHIENISDDPLAIRQTIIDFFSTNSAEWELRAQLCTNLDTMPIENAETVWPEQESPYIAVARIRAPMQDGWTEHRSKIVDDGMSFSPWHGLAAHRPVGSIMRARKIVYEMSAKFRSKRNATPVEEPSSLDHIL